MLGYTCGNDVTARDVQAAEEQWTRAKGFDTFCVLGPRVASVDPSDVGIVTRVNGEVRQHGAHRARWSSGSASCSPTSADCMTLEPGDAVFTGTPAGVGPCVTATSSRSRWRGSASSATPSGPEP